MNFFFVAPRYHPNQIPLVEIFFEEGHKVSFYVVTEEGSEDHSLIKPKHIKESFISKCLFRRKNTKRKYLIPSFSSLFKEFKANKPDVCIIRNPHYFYSFIFTLSAYFYKSKIIIYTQDEFYLEKVKGRHRFYLLLIKLFNAKWITPVLGNSKNGRKLSDKLYHLPLPVNINITEKYIRTDDEINILMVGKFVLWKRHDLFVQAIKEVSKKYPNLSATIIGECLTDKHNEVYRTVTDLIDKNEITNISIKVNVKHNDLLRMYKDYDLFILPSSGETFGMSSLEALSCGVPIIISNANGFKYYVEDGVIGYVFKSGSLSDLIKKIEYCLNEKEYISMGVRALSFTKNNFSKEGYYKKLNKILNRWN